MAMLCAVLLTGAPPVPAEEASAAQVEAEKWAGEEVLDAERLGQTDTGISAIGRVQLAQREWTDEELQSIQTIDAGVLHATRLLRKQGWVERTASLPLRFANAGVLNWLRKNPSVKLVQAQGRLRVDGKYFLVEDCRPADEKPMVAPPLGRSKRSGL
jgi:hypothetical protein